jgi:hypothetical protein
MKNLDAACKLVNSIVHVTLITHMYCFVLMFLRNAESWNLWYQTARTMKFEDKVCIWLLIRSKISAQISTIIRSGIWQDNEMNSSLMIPIQIDLLHPPNVT